MPNGLSRKRIDGVLLFDSINIGNSAITSYTNRRKERPPFGWSSLLPETSEAIAFAQDRAVRVGSLPNVAYILQQTAILAESGV
jgi:hypothetical protein